MSSQPSDNVRPFPRRRKVSEQARLEVGSDPDAIRVLTEAVGAGVIPQSYVSDGHPVVLEWVSGALDAVAGDEDAPVPVSVTQLRPSLLAGLLAEHTDVMKRRVHPRTGKPYTEEVTPSQAVLSAVLARRSWPSLPVLSRVISTPVLRPDGTLLQSPGYDEGTGFYLAGRVQLDPIPDRPTPAMVGDAREFLLGRFLADFPWRTPADRANYLALLATPILRPFTRTLSPFAVVDATMPGSGKTILTCCVGLLVGQRVLTWTDSEDELRKSITTVLGDAAGVVVFDNLPEGSVIDSAVLARLVTERTWTDRRLGSNTAANFANDRLWLATGNNLRTGGDMASRAVWVRLDPDCPRPEARTGFTIPNLDSWILNPSNQAEVLKHLLVLILDWTATGAPTSSTVPAMRQFSRWAQYLGGFLEHHRVPAFLANAEDVASSTRTPLTGARSYAVDRLARQPADDRIRAAPHCGTRHWPRPVGRAVPRATLRPAAVREEPGSSPDRAGRTVASRRRTTQRERPARALPDLLGRA